MRCTSTPIVTALSLLLLAVGGCGGGSSEPAPPPIAPTSLSVRPQLVRVSVGGSYMFIAQAVPANASVRLEWTVSGPNCSGTACGTIDSTGNYRAPATIDEPIDVVVRAAASGLESTAKVTVYTPYDLHERDLGLVVDATPATPPAGITVLAIAAALRDARLQPGDVPLDVDPGRIEFVRLADKGRLVAKHRLPAGVYTGLRVTWAEPTITIRNDTSTPYAGCEPGATCVLEPTASNATVTYGGGAFPVDYDPDRRGAVLQLTLDLARTIADPTAFVPVATLRRRSTPVVQAVGTLTYLDGDRDFGSLFALSGAGGTIRRAFDSGSMYVDAGPRPCPAEPTLDVYCTKDRTADVEFRTDTVWAARHVAFTPADRIDLEGRVSRVSADGFDLVLRQRVPAADRPRVGEVVHVVPRSDAMFTYWIPYGDLDGAPFQSASDVKPGYVVVVRADAGSAGPAVAAERVSYKFGP